jgi:hypothetical protein
MNQSIVYRLTRTNGKDSLGKNIISENALHLVSKAPETIFKLIKHFPIASYSLTFETSIENFFYAKKFLS